MKKGLGWKPRILSVALTIAMLCQGIPALGAEPEGTALPLTPREPQMLEQLLHSQGEEAPRLSGPGTLIVVLEESSLAEICGEQGQSAQEFFNLEDEGQFALVQEEQARLLEEQEQVQQDIRQALGEEPQLLTSYTGVLNGFAIQVTDLGQQEIISQLPGVELVAVSRTWKQPVPEEPETSSLQNDLGFLELPGYQGAGRLVAVVDSGLDVDHAFFQTEPEDTANLAYTKNEMERMISLLNQGLPREKQISSAAWRSNKIPLAWNCEAGSLDTYLSDSMAQHGTHVSGIAVGNQGEHPTQEGETIDGVAPQAQLAFFSVEDSQGNLSDAAILTALDHVVKLAPDAVNGSYGTPYENSSTNGAKVYAKAVEALRQAGVTVAMAAGNSGAGAGGNPVSADQPEYSSSGVPGCIEEAFTVASADNWVRFDWALTVDGGEPVVYYNTVNAPYFSQENGGKELPLLYGGMGSSAEMARLEGEMAGACLLLKVNRDSIPLPAIQTFVNAGGENLLLWFTDLELPDNVQAEMGFPLGLIGAQAGVKLTGDEAGPDEADQSTVGRVGLMEVSSKRIVRENPEAREDPLSDFTSWGTDELLRLKPDIAAPGGAIYSSIPDDTHENYASMSGTSMATPQITGLTALLREWLEKDSGLLDMDLQALGVSREAYLKALLMSTAFVYPQENGLPFSPRRQGAGGADPSAAVASSAFLLGESPISTGEKTANAQLGEIDDSGEFSVKFQVAVTDRSKLSLYQNAKVTAVVLRDEVEEATGTLTGGSVELPAEILPMKYGQSGDLVPMEVKFKLDPTALASLKKQFKNGFFVDGYITVAPLGESTLSLPFMGFYGDWLAAPAYDGTAYDGQSYAKGTELVSTYWENGQEMLLPLGQDEEGSLLGRQDYVAISPNGDGVGDSLYVNTALLRGAQVDWTLSDGKNGELRTKLYSGSKYSADLMQFGFDVQQLAGLPEGSYTLEGKAVLPYGETGREGKTHLFSQDRPGESLKVQVDKTAPKALAWIAQKNGRVLVTFRLSDNYNLFAAQLYSDQSEEDPQEWTLLGVDAEERTVTFDVTGYHGKELYLDVIDYASNVVGYSLRVGDGSYPFWDVDSNSWYAQAVQYTYLQGLLSGVGDNTFGPYTPMNRGMAVTVLHRMAKLPEPQSTAQPFWDVQAGRYYYKAVCWAKEQKVMQGISPTQFAPDSPFTREQLATVLYRSAGEPATSGNLSRFWDAYQVSTYAKTALAWAVEEGIIQGKGSTTQLSPKDTANRAEFAVMLTRYLQ